MIVAGIFFLIMVSGGEVNRHYAEHCVDIVVKVIGKR